MARRRRKSSSTRPTKHAERPGVPRLTRRPASRSSRWRPARASSSRLQAEKARPRGDIIWGVSRSLLQTNKALFEPYASKNNAATPAEYRDPDNLWIGNNLHLLVILQNTKLLPEAEGPKSWADLLDPKWKGKIAFTDPANSGSAYTTVTMLVDMWGGGEAGWKKVAELFRNLKVLNRSSLVFQGVGNGEYPLGISLEYAGPMWAAGGAPVKVDLSRRRHDGRDGRRRRRSRAARTPSPPRSSSTTSTARTCAR